MPATANVVLTAEDKTKAAFASLKNSVNGASNFLGGLKSQLLALAGAAGFGAMIASAVHAGDEIAKLSQRLGASTEALSQYRHVAELSNVSFEGLAKGWQFMEKNISLAAQGTGKAAHTFEELGLSAEALKALKPEEQFEVLADAFSKVENTSDRVSMAVQVFGKAGAELIPIMLGGSSAIREAREEADRLGLTLSASAARDMEEAQDAMTRLKHAFSGVANILAIEFAPALATVAEWLTTHLPEAVQSTVRAFVRLKEFVALVLTGLLAGFDMSDKENAHTTPDANSFRRSSSQIISEMGVAIQRAVRRNT